MASKIKIPTQNFLHKYQIAFAMLPRIPFFPIKPAIKTITKRKIPIPAQIPIELTSQYYVFFRDAMLPYDVLPILRRERKKDVWIRNDDTPQYGSVLFGQKSLQTYLY